MLLFKLIPARNLEWHSRCQKLDHTMARYRDRAFAWLVLVCPCLPVNFTLIYMETYMRRDTYILWWSMANSFSSKHGSGKWTLSLGKWWKMTCKSMIFHFMFISKRVHWDYITWDISPFKYGQMAPPCRGARMCRKHLAQIGEGHSRVVKQFVIDDMK